MKFLFMFCENVTATGEHVSLLGIFNENRVGLGE